VQKSNPTPLKAQTRTQTPRSIEIETTKMSENAAPDVFLESAEYWQRRNLDARKLAQMLSMKLLVRTDNLFGQIAEAFAGQPFIPDIAPDDAKNQHRFTAYITDCMLVSKLMHRAVDLIQIIADTPMEDSPRNPRKKP
jgi:hypothetical protein